MIVLVWPINPKGNDNLVQKRDGWKVCSAVAKIGTSMKHQLIASGSKLRPRKERAVNPAIIICHHRGKTLARLTIITIKVDPQPGSRTARSGIENMRCQPAHSGTPFRVRHLSRTGEECQLKIEDANEFDQDSAVNSSRIPRLKRTAHHAGPAFYYPA
jgi:hypothetical protein